MSSVPCYNPLWLTVGSKHQLTHVSQCLRYDSHNEATAGTITESQWLPESQLIPTGIMNDRPWPGRLDEPGSR